MGRLLEIYNTQQINYEEIESLNRPITGMEVESVIKNLPTEKTRTRWLRW